MNSGIAFSVNSPTKNSRHESARHLVVRIGSQGSCPENSQSDTFSDCETRERVSGGSLYSWRCSPPSSVKCRFRFLVNQVRFAKPALNDLGNSAPNILIGPGVNNWDIGTGELMSLRESWNLQLRADTFNAFNHAQFLNPESNMSDTNFGKITTVGPSRVFQCSVKVLR